MRRLAGLDVARGLALVGMLFAHFARPRIGGGDPGWLQAIDNVADGRAAPLFCMLLGVGAGILAARRGPASVARRGAVLFVLGVAIWPLIDRVYLILPHYGVLLVLAALVSKLPTKVLLPLAFVAWTVPSIGVAVVEDHGMRSADQPETYGDLLDVGSVTWQLLWSGGYPLVGWLGFALTGLWLSRLDLGDAGVQRRLVVGGAVVAATQPLIAATGSTFLDTTAHSNQLGWYVVAAATAVALLGVCSLVAPRPSALRHLGRLALSAYLAHLVIGIHLVWPWRDRHDPSLAAQLGATVAVLGVLATAAMLWPRDRRGPVEAATRFAAGAQAGSAA